MSNPKLTVWVVGEPAFKEQIEEMLKDEFQDLVTAPLLHPHPEIGSYATNTENVFKKELTDRLAGSAVLCDVMIVGPLYAGAKGRPTVHAATNYRTLFQETLDGIANLERRPDPVFVIDRDDHANVQPAIHACSGSSFLHCASVLLRCFNPGEQAWSGREKPYVIHLLRSWFPQILRRRRVAGTLVAPQKSQFEHRWNLFVDSLGSWKSALDVRLGMVEAIGEANRGLGRNSPVTVGKICIVGAPGTGKELVAGKVATLLGKGPESLQSLNCGAYGGDPNWFMAALFGSEKISGVPARTGLIEMAGTGGVVFLDEILKLPMECQPYLLRVLSTGDYRKLGGDKEHKAECHFVFGLQNWNPEILEDLRTRFQITIILELPTIQDRRASKEDPALFPKLMDGLWRQLWDEAN